MRDTFTAWKKSKTNKRAKNRRDGLEVIRSIGVDFLCKNAGAHIIIWPGSPMRVDYWPGTGLWRQTHHVQHYGRGLASLLEYIKMYSRDDSATSEFIRSIAREC